MGEIRVERREDTVVVSVHNPARRNALDVTMWHALTDAFTSVSDDPSIRSVLLRGGTEDSFVAGADIGEFARARATVDQVTRYHEDLVLPCLTSVLSCPAPVVAMIGGPCMGGGLELAAACDLRICSDTAIFGAPVARMGFPLAFAETELLVRTFGRAVIAELLLASHVLDAAAADARGLVHRVVHPSRLAAEAWQWCRDIAAGGARAVASNKRQMYRLLTDHSPVTASERAGIYSFADWDEYQSGYERFGQR